mmetsp:Transcript_11643/g.25672  ORF Transcript_11643/g.25672 Transcript_11643/m.25672 type:complete len:82 (-) Transcript_11643:328-573(-)
MYAIIRSSLYSIELDSFRTLANNCKKYIYIKSLTDSSRESKCGLPSPSLSRSFLSFLPSYFKISGLLQQQAHLPSTFLPKH